MAGALESTITLEDVFAMLGTKRVPLAPELAGYLALEIAEGADGQGGDVDPRSVFIAEEGTVALVKRRDPPTGDPEGSIRVILGRLLEASGSRTPALTAAARRKATGNLRALSEELEAALIPVNRAAGRRALARLAREVKRAAMRVGRAGSFSSLPSFAAQDDAPTARRPMPAGLVEETVPSSSSGGAPRAEPRADLPRPVSVNLEDIAEDEPAAPPSAPRRQSSADVDSLLDQFSRASQRPDKVVARDLKAMAGLDPTPPPPNAYPRASEPPSDGGVEALLALSAPASGSDRTAITGPPQARHFPSQHQATPPQAPISKRAAAARLSQQPPPDSPRPASPIRAPEADPPSAAKRLSQAEIPTGADMRRRAISRISTGQFRQTGKRRSDLWLVAVLLALIAVGAVIVWSLKPGFLTGRTPEKVAQEKAAAEAAHQQALLAQQALACKVALEVTDVPTNAEVLLRQGQAPVDVERMPVGARLEFVATAEGFAPKRAVVPAGVSWDTVGGNKPRYEVAVQLDKASGKPKGDIWPPGEPGSEVGGKGPPGTVHLVTTPRGAEVWLLAGIGPDAHIEGLPCDQDVEVLVAGPTTLRRRIHVPASSFAPGPQAPAEGRFAKISAK
jgi:hypothetical protein